jgi:pilus assembly protein CpaF
MPVVTSHHALTERFGRMAPGETTPEGSGMTALVSAISVKILSNSPDLVAEVAAGRMERGVLEALILKEAEGERSRFGLYREELVRRVLDFMFGYGPLQELVEDDTVSDIDGTRFDEFSIKRAGERVRSDVHFPDEKTFDTYCRLVVIRNNGVLNENDSHCRVTDEARRLRINVAVPPRNVTGPSISIRKHRRASWSLEELAGSGAGMLPDGLPERLRRLAESDRSVLFCGKGAAGKTTLLRAFVKALPVMERVLVAESDSEIFPEKPYCIEQRIKKKNEGGRPVTLRDLVADGLTMSLDTYCIGEIVGDEAYEFLRAAFSGHRCLATVHAESAADSLDRLTSLARPGAFGESERTMKRMVGGSIDDVLFLKRFRLVEWLRVEGYDDGEGRFRFETVWKTTAEPEGRPPQESGGDGA